MMRLHTVSLSLLSLAGLVYSQVAVKSGMTSDSYCGQGYCFTALYDPSQQATNYTLVVPQGGAPMGWMAVAQGTQMVGANMAVNWVNADGSTTTSHRGAQFQEQPLESYVTTTAGFAINREASRSMNGMTTWSWNFPQTTAPGAMEQHVYAVSSTSPSSSASDATIVKHYRHDTGITLDMTKAYTGAPPAGLAGGQGSSATAASSGATGNRDLGDNVTRIYLVHMIFMVLGWMLLAPLGILIARYGRTMFTWFPYHRGVQLSAFLLIFIAFFLAIAAVGMEGGGHFDQTHNQLGLALFLLLIVQIALGASTHYIRNKTGKRYISFAHITMGLILFGLSVYQIHLGFDTWDWAPPAAASYVIYAWAALMFVLYVAGFALLPKELRQAREAKTEKDNVSDEQLTATRNS